MAVNPYELQRKRVAEESAKTSGEEGEALKRRFARMGGGLQSGSYIKAQERLSGMQEQNKQRALESVDIQESLAEEQKAEAERGRQFARGERLGSQEFASGESALGRRFASEEAERGRGWQSGEAEKTRGWQTKEREYGQQFITGERLGAQEFANKTRAESQDWQRAERLGSQEFAAGESRLVRDAQESQFARQFGAEQDVNEFNKAIAMQQAQLTPERIALMIKRFRAAMSNEDWSMAQPKVRGEAVTGRNEGWTSELATQSENRTRKY